MELYHPQFFTATVLNWKKLLKPDKYKKIITDSLQFLVENNRVIVFGFVIMPNHVHIIWQMEENVRPEDVKRDFLKYTSQRIKSDLISNHPKVLELFKVDKKDRMYQIWKHRPLSIDLWTRDVLLQKLDYIHNNPIQEHWKLAEFAEEYRFSSASFYYNNKKDWSFISHYNE